MICLSSRYELLVSSLTVDNLEFFLLRSSFCKPCSVLYLVKSEIDIEKILYSKHDKIMNSLGIIYDSIATTCRIVYEIDMNALSCRVVRNQHTEQ